MIVVDVATRAAPILSTALFILHIRQHEESIERKKNIFEEATLEKYSNLLSHKRNKKNTRISLAPTALEMFDGDKNSRGGNEIDYNDN